GMGLSPDGKILVATSETSNMAHFIDTETRRIVANVLVDARPRFAEFKRDASEVWVSAETSPAWMMGSQPARAASACGRSRPWVSEIAPMVRIMPDQPTRGAACAGSPVRTAAFDVISCRQGWGPLAG